MATSAEIKSNNNTLIRVKTTAKSITKANVADQLDASIDYTVQEISTLSGVVSGKELLTNKSIDIIADGSSDTKYPSVKAVKTYVDANPGAIPYKVYSSLLTYDFNGVSAVFTEKILQNNTGVSINWTNPSNGRIQGNASSGTPFTADKTMIINSTCTSSDGVYFAIGWHVSSSIVRIILTKHDGTVTGTPYFTDQPIEIRVYN